MTDEEHKTAGHIKDSTGGWVDQKNYIDTYYMDCNVAFRGAVYSCVGGKTNKAKLDFFKGDGGSLTP